MFKGLRMRLLINILVIVIVMAFLNLVVNVYQYQEQANKQMKEKASVVAQQFIAMRKFVSQEQDTINTDTKSGNYEFKHLNPATVGRQVADIFKAQSGYTIKQTRLRPRVALNAPDQYELDVMQKMAVDSTIQDSFSTDTVNGERMYRYIKPLYFEESCLSCHGTPQGEPDLSGFPKEGGSVGDFAGAISVMFPAKPILDDVQANTIAQAGFLLAIIIITFLIMYLTLGRIVVKPLKELTMHVDKLGSMAWEDSLTNTTGAAVDEMRHLGLAFNAMSEKMQSSYTNLEDKVEERTVMLQEANEQLREKSQELQRINLLLSDSDRMKSELTATISSGLRLPLNSIIAFSQSMLANQYEQQDSDQYLRDILWNAQNLDDQISDLLAMSKIEAGLMGLEYEEFRFEDVIHDIRRMMNPIFARKNLKFNIEIATTTPPIVADLEKMKHIFRNLLSNSLKYTPEGGWVRVRIEPMPVSKEGKELILIQISDSGVGIKAEDLPDIFTKMWKNDGSQSSQSGLGLAIAKIFIELQGGSIEVKSIWQKGTLFSLRLPYRPD